MFGKIAVGLLTVLVVPAAGQFVPGSQEIYVFNLAGTPAGQLPAGVQVLRGSPTVVDRDGSRMLKAVSETELLITLPRALPEAFTLEFDLIPSACCNSEDLAFEGTPALSRSAASAQVSWHSHNVRVAGGGPPYEGAMPSDLRETVPGQLTTVAASFEGETVKLYTNGRRMTTLSERRFVRGKVLRVFLGGQNGPDQAVYLARLRIAAKGPADDFIASQKQGAGATPLVSAPASAGARGTELALEAIAGLNVTLGAGGPVVNWNVVRGATTYSVQRWKADDTQCCNNATPRTGVRAPPWTDAPLPVSGTFVYRVTAFFADDRRVQGEVQFGYRKPEGPVIAATPEPVPVVLAPSPPPVTGTITPTAMPTTVSGIQVTLTPTGPVVTWTPVQLPARYAVQRWKTDDLNCCSNSTSRLGVPGPPWSDQPLPAPGTYTYRVTALLDNDARVFGETQFTYGTTAVIATAPPVTGTITPLPAPSPSTTPTGGERLDSRAPTAPLAPEETGLPPSEVWASGTPVTVTINWRTPWITGLSDNDAGLTFRVNRSLAGGGSFTLLTPVPITTPSLTDIPPDRSKTYTYRVTVVHPDGKTGSASVDYTPPPPEDPRDFTATVKGPAEVELSWQSGLLWMKDVKTYFITGPGAGNGMSVTPTLTGAPHRWVYTLRNLPPGTHTWTVAASYEPGGILTVREAWPKATATLGPDANSGKYQIVVESVRVTSFAEDDLLGLDGKGNEIYVSAIVDRFTRTGGRVGERSFLRSATHGDITSWPPPARVRAGSWPPNGGINAGDVIAPIWAQPDAGATGYSRLVLWEGTLADGGDVVAIRPMVWESDAVEDEQEQSYQAFLRTLSYIGSGFGMTLFGARAEPVGEWLKKTFPYYTQYAERVRQRILEASLTPLVAPEFNFEPDATFSDLGDGLAPQCDCVSFHLFGRGDRPIGLASKYQAVPVDDYAVWMDLQILVTREAIEKTLASTATDPGLLSIRLLDRELNGLATQTHPRYGGADYTLTLRVQRIP